jgi:hypothetical protein
LKRTDPKHEIKDEKAIPSKELNSKEFVQKGKDAIAELTKGETQWTPILQAALTQTSLNAGLRELIYPLTLLKSDTWTENNDDMTLDIDFEYPPIKLNIMRDKAGKIQEAQFEFETNIDIHKRDLTTDKDMGLIKSNVIKANMSYSITLVNGQPKVLPVSINFTAHFQ